MRLGLNIKIGSNNSPSLQWNRRNLLLFKRICHKTASFLPQGAIERSKYLLEYSENITMECYIADELLDLEAMDAKIMVYILGGENAGAAVLPELKELINYVERNMEISPFDVLNYKAWDETPQSLREFMNSSKGGTGKGRKKTIRKMLSDLLPQLDDYEDLKSSYYHLVFEEKSGYGSGLTTYEWAFRLADMIDKIICKLEDNADLREALASQPELAELSIHQFFLSEFKHEAMKIVAALGKRILYGDDVQQLVI